jgi:pimeloyl-ACP methyl ester carboxylesterase
MADLVATPYESRYYNWRGWRMRYLWRRGTGGLPIICVHGFGAAADHWRSNIPDLAELGTVYSLDLLGFGSSQKPACTYRIQLWAEQLYEFWQKYINRPALLIGNSIGALVVTIAASQYPAMGCGVVAISLPDIQQLQAMIPPLLLPLQQAVAWVLAKPLFYWVRRPAVIRSVLKQAIYPRYPHRVDQELMHIICQPTRDRSAPEAFLRLSRSVNSPHYSPNLRQALTNLTIPVLILWGTLDRAIPPTEGKRLIAYLRDGELLYLDNLGHCPHDEDPQQVNLVIKDWVQRTILTPHC